MTYLTQPFFAFIFAVAPYGLPLLVVDLIALYLMIFRERFEPRTLIFWVAIVIVVPFLGFLLYLVFGSTLVTRYVFGRKAERDRRFLEVGGDDCRGIPGVMRAAGADVCTHGNKVSMHWDRNEMQPTAVREMADANESIHLMFRRVPQNHDALYDVMEEMASKGVDVRLMTSSLGFGRTPDIRRLEAAGVRFCTFHRPVYSMFSSRPANRNLRSMVVIDGRVAYQGRGAVVRIEGPAAARLEMRFRADWLHGSGEDLGADVPEAEACGNADVQVVSDGPDCSGSTLSACYTELITRARRRLHISTPYLLPNDELYSAVKLAVLSGVEVIMLLPAKGRHWYQSWNSLAASNPLMMAGAKVYFADRSMSKCVIVADGEVCCVGSGDYCGRSLRNDFNTGCLVYSKDVAEEADRCFRTELEDAAECHPEEYTRRSFADRIRIAVARLLMFLN